MTGEALRRLMLALAVSVGSAGLGWADDRLAVGLRVSRWWLEDSRRSGANGLDNRNPDNFLGSLWGLDPQQGYVPLPFLEYRVVSVVGVGAAYDEARVKTLDWGNDEHTATAGDGDLRIRGLQVYAFGCYPNRTRVTPYIRAGWGRYWSAFFESPGWALPGRFFEVQDARGWFAGASISVALWKRVGMEASYEHLALADIEAKAHLQGGGHKRGAFPMRSDALRVGVVYRF